MQKRSEALPSQVFQVVCKSYQGQRAGKVFILLYYQSKKGTLEARAQCPLVVV